MSQGFLQCLDLDETSYCGGNLIVVQQLKRTDASFVLHHLVSDYVKHFGDQSRILLVLSQQNAAHWNSISAKLGWNLFDSIAKRRVAVLDLTQEMYKRLTDKQYLPVLQGNSSFNLDALLRWCKDRISEMIPSVASDQIDDLPKEGTVGWKSKIFVVIDDLPSIFYNLDSVSRTEADILKFIHDIINLNDDTSDRRTLSEISIATVVSSMGELSFSTVAYSLATVRFEVSPLQTGFSQLFHGYISVTRRPVDACDTKRATKTYHYKLEDRQDVFRRYDSISNEIACQLENFTELPVWLRI